MQYKGQIIHSNAPHGWHALCVSLFQVHVYLQSSLAGETFTAKHAFESTLQSFGFSVSNYHGDYGIFASRDFKDDCHVKKKITFSGSGAHHQMELRNTQF